VITNVVCETEAPSRPDISSFATSIRHADSDWGQPKTPYTEQEAFKSSCIEYSSVKDLTDLSDSLEDRQDSPDESETHLTQETISSPELQKSNEALQVIDMGLACQDTCQTTNTKPVIADRRFDQLYFYIGEVSQDLTLRETDEVNFIRKGKQSRPPDVDTKLIEDNKCCCPGVVQDPSSSLCTCTGAWTTNEDP
jgi:hypothetical protein